MSKRKSPAKAAKPRAVARAPRTEGQRLLLAVAASQAEVASVVGVNRSAVGFWRRGEKTPDARTRAKLRDAYGIDPRAWEQAPTVAPPSVPPEADTPPTPTPKRKPSPKPAQPPKPTPSKPSTLDEVEEQLARLRRLQENDALLASEQVRLADSVGKLLAIKARLERDHELLEDRIVRQHPFYARLKGAILEALKPHQEATRDVAEALGHLEAG